MVDILSGIEKKVDPNEAITIIFTKIESSENKNLWYYLIKNLIILDRCIDRRVFLVKIAKVRLVSIE
jgi:hypothetical protein